MNWREKAQAEARTRWTVLAHGLQRARQGLQAFVQGAMWQRQQLLGRESIERAARALEEANGTSPTEQARRMLLAAIEGDK